MIGMSVWQFIGPFVHVTDIEQLSLNEFEVPSLHQPSGTDARITRNCIC